MSTKISEEGQREESRLWAMLENALVVDDVDDLQKILGACEAQQRSTPSAHPDLRTRVRCSHLRPGVANVAGVAEISK